jgi:hypothetical protein
MSELSHSLALPQPLARATKHTCWGITSCARGSREQAGRHLVLSAPARTFLVSERGTSNEARSNDQVVIDAVAAQIG